MMSWDKEKVKEFGGFELLARQLVEGFITGLHQSPYHGFSVEFAEHRLYNPGESTRFIDWKVFARTDRLYTKQYEEETNLRCMLVIDNSSSMHHADKMGFSLTCAACLTYMLHRQRDAVGLSFFDDQIRYMSEVKSTGAHIQQLFTIMEQVSQQPHRNRATDVAHVLHQIAEQIHRRSLVVIFSDLFDSAGNDEAGILAALQHLRHNRHEVLFFHVYDRPTEVELDYQDRPTLFIDLETGRQIKANPAELRLAYQKATQERFKRLALACGSLKIDFIPADSSLGVNQVLQAYLVKRKRMG